MKHKGLGDLNDMLFDDDRRVVGGREMNGEVLYGIGGDRGAVISLMVSCNPFEGFTIEV